jgi:hypothetical protein
VEPFGSAPPRLLLRTRNAPTTRGASSSEIRTLELPEFVPIPAPTPPPPLKEIEEDLSVYASSDTPGVKQRIGPKVSYRRLVPDWPKVHPPPEPTTKPKRKTRSPKEAA